ncbi:MFS transporter [Poseidonibacter ostreae]|jgi:MFS family permease|uniref:MFS transporter n=1 Tax=Poseidonibacter ostreae TaxID=2654171 RepID=A0A6L4WQE3_9BACT|nr:MFS transporter [Poseidonibacter ostreae]KAB7881916.1 MFS transporter [Poseidonibacter ostreae]KAB7886872.1 MFS transporter [Poseidonibacter ostreae]KAB7889923.1 MFS transporter [Poseidonibacter ostreae]
MSVKKIIFPISSLFFAIGFLAIGYGMILTFIGIYLKELEVSNSIIGIINACFFLGAVLSSIFSQKIISSVGHIRSFAAFAALMVITFLLHAVFFNEILWAVLRLISGFSFYALLIILESWLNEKGSEESRGKILAIYTIVFYLATAIGQLFLNIDEHFKQFIFTIGSALVLFSVIFISLTKIKEPVLTPFDKFSFPKIFSIVPLATVTSFISGFLIGGFFSMLPVYILMQSDSVELVSKFMLISIIGGLISQWPVGMLSDKFGRRKLISIVSFISAFTSLLFVVYANEELYLLILGFSLGLTVFTLYPLAVARANDVVDENKDIVEISRTLLFTYGIGSFFSPLIIGVGLSFSPNFLFVCFFVLCLALSIYALTQERVKDKDLSVFVNIPITSGAELPELDPRQDEEYSQSELK